MLFRFRRGSISLWQHLQTQRRQRELREEFSFLLNIAPEEPWNQFTWRKG